LRRYLIARAFIARALYICGQVDGELLAWLIVYQLWGDRMLPFLELACITAIKALVDHLCAHHNTAIVQTLQPCIDAALETASKAADKAAE
jgi:hypothetical protein